MRMNDFVKRFSAGRYVCDIGKLAGIYGYVVYILNGDVKCLLRFGLTYSLESAENEALAHMMRDSFDINDEPKSEINALW